MTGDIIQKAISENGEAVVYALDATLLVQESMERLGSWPPATKHLGQSMMAALLLQALADSDDNESLSLQWMCEGPFGHLFAEARDFGTVRGTIREPRPSVSDYETSLGAGLLQVRRAKEGRAGTTSIVKSKGVVSLDIVEYLEQSEQKNCGVNFTVVVDWADESKSALKVRSALAYLIHILPQPTEAKLNDALVRWNRQMESLGAISRWQLREDQVTLDMLRLITGEPEPRVVMTQRVTFRCNCSVERAERALTILENQEEKEGKERQSAAETTQIRCEYCGKVYTIKPRGKPRTSKAISRKKKAAPKKVAPAKKKKAKR